MARKNILILILVISAILRLYGLSRGDTVNDEVFMAFRGIGMLDFDEAAAQTTPLEWWDPNIPWWTNLSFHDHPLLVPAAQNLFMKVFGENNFAFRLPSAILGVVSVYLIYLIGAALYSEKVGLISAGLLGVTLNNVYISRTGLQEPYVIFFLLLASYLFIKSLKEPRYLFWVGAAIGLGAEAKYNVLILAPIFLTYLAVWQRDYFKNKYFWQGATIFLLLVSPTIIYNLMLYRTVGHLDFQFSNIFGERPEVWKIQPGKEIGSFTARIQNFVPRLIASHSWIFLSLTVLSFIAFLVSLFKNFKNTLENNKFLLLVISYLLLLLLLIGPSYRFLTMLTPFLALAAAIFIINRLNHSKLAIGALILIFGFEIFYSWNNQIAYYPVGPTPWLSSKVRFENYNWGYNELNDWLENKLNGKMPAITFDLKYQFLERLRERALAEGNRQGLELYPALFVYAGNFDGGAKLWILDRFHIYHAWPIISLETYYQTLREKEFDYYDRVGFKEKYFILQTNMALSPEIQVLSRGLPTIIKNKRGDEVFGIYKF
ncbi:MAG: glycosyltransferase family 39 protein [Candidatus Harrisonbacteria bacterium]|nr:glycosyltransferase family 39 protein [Candidatus Harrisonbacteria bacterium]